MPLPPAALVPGTWYPVQATGRDSDGDLGGVWVEVETNGSGDWTAIAADPAGVNGGDGFATTTRYNGFTAGPPGTTYKFRMHSYDQAGNDTGYFFSSIYTVPFTSALRVNAGGSAYTGPDGYTWAADHGFNAGSSTSTEPGTVVIVGTPNPTIYKTVRFDPATAAPDIIYTFTVPNGNYNVRLHLAETSSSVNAAGQRLFNVDLQSQRALTNVDIFARAGNTKYKAVIAEAPATVTAGQLIIRLGPVAGIARVEAIEVLGGGASDTQPPTAPSSMTFTAVTSNSVTVNWGASTDNVGVTGYRLARSASVIGTTSGALSFTETGLSPSTSYTYSVVALDAAGNASTITSASVTTPAAASFTGIRVNAGGPGYTDSAGNVWAADNGYNTGKTYTTTATVTGTADPVLYRTERWDEPTGAELTYAFSVPNGDYQVRLHFAETYASTQGAGLRVFDVNLQSALAFDDVDIFALAGGGSKALILTKTITVTNGQATIGLVRQVENPKINAIEILPAPTTILRVNAGGPAYTDTAGNLWSADTGYYNTGSVATSTATVSGTADPTLFKTERYDPPAGSEMVYTFAVPNGSYLLKLYFAETYASTKGAGLRVFDVNVQGALAIDNVDIFAQAGGGDKALVLQTAASVSNGQLTLGFVRAVENPKINAIEILSTSGGVGDTQPPTIPSGLVSSNVTASGAKLTWTASTDNVGVTGYSVSRNTVVIQTVNALTFTDSGLSAATAYQYAVRAVDAAGNSSSPASLTVTTTGGSDVQAPTVPANLVATNITTTGFTLSWSASTDNVGVAGYNVKRGTVAVTPSPTGTSITVTGLAAGQSYQMTVQARDAAGNVSGWSSAYGVTTSPSNPNGNDDSDDLTNGLEATLGTNPSVPYTSDPNNQGTQLNVQYPR